MTITGTRAATAKFSGSLAGEAEQHDRPGEGRALVAVTPATHATHEIIANYRPAAFLAQLIANKDQLPQTRERRRAAPAGVIAAYRAAEALTSRN
jgi:hypothetical protein